MKDQWDYVLNDLEEQEVQNCSWRIRTILKYFLFSSSSCRASLPLFVRPMMTVQEMFLKIILYFSRIQSLYHRLEVGFHDEEDGSISATLDNLIAIVFLVRHQTKFSPWYVWFLWMNWQNIVFVIFLLPLIRLQHHPHSILTHILRTAFLRFPARCCSSKFENNLFKPWEILTHEWELSLFTDLILI